MKIFAGMLVVALSYVGAYFLLSKPDAGYFCALGCAGSPYTRVAEFRVGGETARRLFAPLTWADHELRPVYWDGVELFDGTSVASGDPRASGIVPGGGFSGSMPSASAR
jgi:hypothetical protein